MLKGTVVLHTQYPARVTNRQDGQGSSDGVGDTDGDANDTRRWIRRVIDGPNWCGRDDVGRVWWHSVVGVSAHPLSW
jgi:hypothetical protein